MTLKKTLIYVNVIFSLFCSAKSFGNTIHLGAYFYTNSCEYFSAQVGAFHVSYENKTLPPDARVFVRYGFGQTERTRGHSVWNLETEKELIKSDDNTWAGDFSQAIVGRGGPQYESLQFVLRIVGAREDHSFFSFWEKGNESTFGYFQSEEFPKSIPCANFYDLPVRDMPILKFEPVEKW